MAKRDLVAMAMASGAEKRAQIKADADRRAAEATLKYQREQEKLRAEQEKRRKQQEAIAAAAEKARAAFRR